MILIAATPRIYEFFRELAKPYDPGEPPGPPNQRDMQRLIGLAAKYGYWVGSPEDNDSIGLAQI
jgi:hypothetical protein